MSIVEIVKSVEVVIDDEGKKKAILDWQTWAEVVAILEGQFQPRTELGRQLWAARVEILASGLPTLNQAEVEQEVMARRGGQL